VDDPHHLFDGERPRDAVFFLSDVHLGSGDTALEELKKETLFSFLDMVCREGVALYILGDLFDFWFEYGNVVSRDHTGLLFWLERLRRNGVDIHYVVGNHDYWVGATFEEGLGVKVYRKPVVLDIEGKRAFLTHGDGLGKGDPGYKALKGVLRNRVSIFLYSLIHPWLGYRLARRISEFTKGDYEKKSAKASMALRVYAFDYLEKHDVDLFITGHTHTPELIKVKGKLFLNTGDWIRHFTYAVIRDGRLRLMRWRTREEIAPVTVGELGHRASRVNRRDRE
jgi:UDP-2,3-diacylglucosamine hydrolase